METEIRIPETLLPVFQGEADVRGAYGGRGSGKTRSFALVLVIDVYEFELQGREGIILCARQFMNSLKDSSLEELKAAIRSVPEIAWAFELGDKYIRTISGRIHFTFVGLDRNVDSVKSKSRILRAWIDEAEPVTDDAWLKLIPTLREEDAELWVTWNPESKYSATHKRFRESRADPRVKIVECNWRDNPWFPAILERQRKRDLSDRPEQYDHVWEGGFKEIYEGAYYAPQMAWLADNDRIIDLPANPDLPVHTVWDLGIGDSTAIWFWQIAGNEIRVIDHYEASGQGLPHYAEVIKSKGYAPGDDWVPHDAKVRELGTGRTRVETLRALGLSPRLVPNHRIEDGINAVRETLPHCWFDRTRCDYGLDMLRQYHAEMVEERGVLKNQPFHDRTSHTADAMRYLAMAWRELQPARKKVDPIKELLKPMTFDQMMEDLEFEDVDG